MNRPYVNQLLTGKVKKIGDPNAANPLDREWESGIFKQAVHGKVWLSKNGIMGDEIGDRKNHGGPEKALFAYPVSHYAFWQNELEIASIGIGAMGENLAVTKLDETSICIGDTYQFGEAVIQVSQPRQPCWKPARRFRIMDFALRIQHTGRTGWYFRVLQEGYIEENTPLKLLRQPDSTWTIAKCNEVMHEKKEDIKLAEELLSSDFLAERWKKTLSKRIAGKASSIEKRVYGPNKEDEAE